MAYLDYKLRSPGSFDVLILRALRAPDSMADGNVALPNRTGAYDQPTSANVAGPILLNFLC